MSEHLFESPSYYMDYYTVINEDDETKGIIVCKATGRKAIFEPYAFVGLINTIYQQADMGYDYSITLERIGNTIELGGFF